MQEQVSASLRQMSELAAPGNTPSLDEVRDKIEQRYANALGSAELAQNSVQGRMLEVAGQRGRHGGREPAGADPRVAARHPGGGRGHGGQHRAHPRAHPADQHAEAARHRLTRSARRRTSARDFAPRRRGAKAGAMRAASPARLSARGRARLARRAPVGHPRVHAVALRRRADPGAAAAAALPAPLEHPVLTAAAQLAGGRLLRPVGVAQQQLAGERDHPGRVGHVAR